jgi:hypothetical protein
MSITASSPIPSCRGFERIFSAEDAEKNAEDAKVFSGAKRHKPNEMMTPKDIDATPSYLTHLRDLIALREEPSRPPRLLCVLCAKMFILPR